MKEVFSDIFSAWAREQVPQVSPESLVTVLSPEVTGEESYIALVGIPCSTAAARVTILKVEPVCRPAFAQSKPFGSSPP